MDMNFIAQIPDDAIDFLEIHTHELATLLEQRGEFYNISYLAIDETGHLQAIEGSIVDQKFDCICCDDIMSLSASPFRILIQLRQLLKPDGCILFSVPNAQHWLELNNLLVGDIQKNQYLHTYASFIKLLLDTGYEPTIPLFIFAPPIPADNFLALQPLLKILKLDDERTKLFLSTSQYVFKATINPFYDVDRALQANTFPISFIVPMNDQRVIRDNFLKSPIFHDGHIHQIIPVTANSAAEALEVGISYAQHDFVVYAHQDVYLPQNWDTTFCHHVIQAKQQFSNAALFGLYGAGFQDGQNFAAGIVADRHKLLKGGELPHLVNSLDEFLFGFYKDQYVGTAVELGWHLYGTDMSYRYAEQGKLTVVVHALCFHNSLGSSDVPQAYYDGMKYIRSHWHRYLPIATVCSEIHPDV